jgi:hypothetical protein
MARASALLALGKIGGTAHPSSRSDPARIMRSPKRQTLGNTGLVALMPMGSTPAIGVRFVAIRETAARAQGATKSGSDSKVDKRGGADVLGIRGLGAPCQAGKARL